MVRLVVGMHRGVVRSGNTSTDVCLERAQCVLVAWSLAKVSWLRPGRSRDHDQSTSSPSSPHAPIFVDRRHPRHGSREVPPMSPRSSGSRNDGNGRRDPTCRGQRCLTDLGICALHYEQPVGPSMSRDPAVHPPVRSVRPGTGSLHACRVIREARGVLAECFSRAHLVATDHRPASPRMTSSV